MRLRRLKIAAGAAEIANLNFVESNRPWVATIFVSDPIDLPVWMKGPGDYLRLKYIWVYKNAGKRPAIITSIKTTDGFYPESCGTHPVYDAIPHDHELPPEGKESAKKPFVSRGFILPDSLFKSVYVISVSNRQWNQLHERDPNEFAPKLKFCVYSLLEYEDVAFPKVIHHFRRCSEFAPLMSDTAFIECPDNGYTGAD